MWISLRRMRRFGTTCLRFKKIEECRIFFLKIHKVSEFEVFKSIRMRYICDGLMNLINCINYKIVNAICKSLAITLWLRSPLKDSRSCYLIYNRNLTKILEVGLSMTMKFVNFIFRNIVQRFFQSDTSKLFV